MGGQCRTLASLPLRKILVPTHCTGGWVGHGVVWTAVEDFTLTGV